MADETVIVALRATGQRAFSQSMKTASTDVSKVGAAAKKVDTQLDKTQRSGKKAGGGFARAASGIKGFVAGAAGMYGAQQVIGDSVTNAVDLGEQMSKTAVVFRGPGAKSIRDWSGTTAKGLGIAQSEALTAAGTFGNMLVPMGFARKRAADMSQRMVSLGSDMASFNNASPEETLDALRSGLAGETEPLRRFGVFLNDARLKQQAMSMGLYKGKGPLDANAKAQATYALILKDTKDAQGDFQRTSDSLANRQRILKAQYTEITATLGQKLLPILSFLANNIPEVAIAVGAMAAAWLAYNAAALIASATTTGLGAAMKAAFLTNPVGIVLVGLIALGAALVIAYRKVGWFRNAVNAAFKAIKGVVSAVFGWIKSHWMLLLGILTGPIGLAVVAIIRHWDKIKNGAKAAIDFVKDRFNGLKSFLSGLFSGAGSWISGIGRGLADWLNANTPFGDRVEFSVLGKSVGFDIPALAAGGRIMRPGSALVGERGPELLSLPAGASVRPLQGPAPALSSAGMVTAEFYLDRRLIATAVARDTADRQARR